MSKKIYRPKREVRVFFIARIAVAVILLAIFFSLFVSYYVTKSSSTAKCVMQASNEAVFKVAANGGYLAPENAVQYNSYSVPIYMADGTEKLPTLDEISANILRYVKEAKPECSPDIKVRCGSKVKVGKTFSHANVDVDMETVYSEAIGLYDKQKTATTISLAELARMAKQGNYVLHINANNNTILYFMTFTKETIGDKPVVYSFGIKR